MMKSLSVFSGNSNRPLAQEICDHLGVPLGQAEVSRFSDGEVRVEVGENVRGVSCFVVQPTCASPGAPGGLSSPNESLMELLVIIDALKRASAGSVAAVVPYFGYARQDRKAKPRTPITAKLVANLIAAAGADRVLSVDLHAGQIQGFFDIPVDNLYAMPVLVGELRERGICGDGAVVVSPDAGGVERARGFAKRLGAGLAIVDKRRPAPNVSEVMNVVGDVRGKRAVVVDDMIDTAGTLASAARAIMDAGAATVAACASHAVLSGSAPEKIAGSPLEHVVVTNTIPRRPATNTISPRPDSLRILVKSVAPLVGEAIKRIHHGDSISSLFA